MLEGFFYLRLCVVTFFICVLLRSVVQHFGVDCYIIFGGGMNKQPVNNQPCCTRCAVLCSVALCYATFSVVFSVVLCSGVFCCVLLCGMGTAANCSQRSLRVSVYSVMAAETSLKELRSLCNVCEHIHKKTLSLLSVFSLLGFGLMGGSFWEP